MYYIYKIVVVDVSGGDFGFDVAMKWKRVDAIESKEERQKEHVGEQQAVASIDLYAFLSR